MQIELGKFYILESNTMFIDGPRCYGMFVEHPAIELYDEKGLGLFQVYAMENDNDERKFVPFFICYTADQVLTDSEIEHVKFLAQTNLLYPETI